MRYAFTIIFLLVTTTTLAQQAECDSITWSPNKRLTWADYHGHPVAATRVAAVTHYSFVHQWHIADGVFIGKVVACFDPCLSWSKDKTSTNLLTHELGHFDIAEFFRRVYNKRIAQASFTAQNVDEAEAQIYAQVRSDCEQVQALYDIQTNHGLVADKQALWLQHIQGMLDSMSQYDVAEAKLKLIN